MAVDHYIPGMSGPVIARARRPSPILVCKKCLKRASEGAEIRRELKHELKRQCKEALKPARLISTECFGICPKRAVVLASGRSLQDGKYVLVSHAGEVEPALQLL
jgi:predicted metal-binding protein